MCVCVNSVAKVALNPRPIDHKSITPTTRPLSHVLVLSLSPFQRPFSRWTWVSRCLPKQRMMEVVVTAGALSRAMLQSNDHHQQTNNQFFYRPDALPVAQPTVSKHWTEKYHIPWTCLLQARLGGLPTLSLTTNSSWLHRGRVVIPLISPLMPVPHSSHVLLLLGKKTTTKKTYKNMAYCWDWSHFAWWSRKGDWDGFYMLSTKLMPVASGIEWQRR